MTDGDDDDDDERRMYENKEIFIRISSYGPSMSPCFSRFVAPLLHARL